MIVCLEKMVKIKKKLLHKIWEENNDLKLLLPVLIWKGDF